MHDKHKQIRTEMTQDQTTTRFEGDKLVVETGTETEEFDAEYLVAVLLFSIASSEPTILS
jgi:hypothetical protein